MGSSPSDLLSSLLSSGGSSGSGSSADTAADGSSVENLSTSDNLSSAASFLLSHLGELRNLIGWVTSLL